MLNKPVKCSLSSALRSATSPNWMKTKSNFNQSLIHRKLRQFLTLLTSFSSLDRLSQCLTNSLNLKSCQSRVCPGVPDRTITKVCIRSGKALSINQPRRARTRRSSQPQDSLSNPSRSINHQWKDWISHAFCKMKKKCTMSLKKISGQLNIFQRQIGWNMLGLSMKHHQGLPWHT